MSVNATYDPKHNPRAQYGTWTYNVIGDFLNIEQGQQLAKNLENDWLSGDYPDREAYLKAALQRIEGVYAEYAAQLNQVATTTIGVPAESIASMILQTAGNVATIAQPFGLLIKGFGYVLSKAGENKVQAKMATMLKQAEYLKGQLEVLQTMYTSYKNELLTIQYTRLLPLAIAALILWYKKARKSA